MPISKSLLYLLLLYAVLDKNNKLSLTTGLTIAFVIMLMSCYLNCCRPRHRSCGGNSRRIEDDDDNFSNLFATSNAL
ncbi:MAG: hypothetical protein RR086_03410 [Clostridia bacterium]